jgi:hypothetical protein
MPLADVLLSPDQRSRVVDDCMTLIDQEVADKGGLTGMALKAGYKAVQGVRPNFVKNVVNDLLPDFAKGIEPVYDEAKAQSKGIADHLSANKARVADALLAITDRRAERTKFTVVKAAYDRLRGTAKQHVEAAVPRLGRLVERYAP